MTRLLLKIFVRDWEKPQSPQVRAACGKLAGMTGIACNLLLSAGKFVIGIVSGSVSVTADAVNNLMDVSASAVTMLGFRLAEKPADAEHPYGHARMEYLSGLAVAGLILVVGWELVKSSLQKIIHPVPAEFTWPMAAALLLSMGLKLWLGHFQKSVGRKIHSSTLTATAADSRNDVIATGAVLASCVIGKVTSWNPDGYVGIAVALFILYSGIGIVKDTAAPLLGKAPDAETVHNIRQRLLQCPHVLGIHDLMIHDYGPGRIFASVHVEMAQDLDPLFSHNLIDDMEQQFLQQDNLQMVIHYDPVCTNDAELDRCRRQVEEAVASVDKRLTFHDFRVVAGPMHTNVIFDLVVPFDFGKDEQSVKDAVIRALEQKYPDYRPVIRVDSDAFN